MTNRTPPEMTGVVLRGARAADTGLDELFAADAVPAYGHAENHATSGLSANDEAVYVSDLDALFAADTAMAYGHGAASSHVTCGLSDGDETPYVPAS